MVKWLCEHDADLNARNHENRTPLNRAIFSQQKAVVEWLSNHTDNIGNAGKLLSGNTDNIGNAGKLLSGNTDNVGNTDNANNADNTENCHPAIN